MSRSPDPVAALRAFFLRRMERFGRHAVRTVLAPAPAFLAPDPELLALLLRHRAPLLHWLDAVVAGADPLGRRGTIALLADHMTQYLLDHNQYLVVDDALHARLDTLYLASTVDLRDAVRRSRTPARLAAALPAVFAAHQRRLSDFLRALAAAHADAGADFAFREPVSAEHSPELQLEVLGLDPRRLLEPVLDLGCGPSASLVRRLRAAGVDARGLDRDVVPEKFLFRGDWLEAPLGRSRWGTIVSHLGFSMHFLHHHLRPRGSAERYARRYLELLRALRPGGSFCYVPALPFIESLLPSTAYALSRRAPPRDLPAADGAAGMLSARVWRAACVTRKRKM
jgi:SAM-dependent methyltransferase